MSFLESDYYFCLFTLYKVNKNSVPAMHMQVIGHLLQSQAVKGFRAAAGNDLLKFIKAKARR